ncbi:DUF456 domain-containing protein [Williamsia sp. CHRR-6]|uniref:DUF456 domain-containing protein n=1 Tax=Williamsia sp. CHRR-6 TaxID=2835871 RepID=UPI001BDB1CB8|nr:DUF456 domain-containing protein [Williamsia sp. CHRR-6]MBT0566176.1 DUF456 domain-containing protein [Williamsia sp. CHRR-6]
MPFWGELIVGVVILIGLVGTVVPVLPGPLLVVAAIVVWALFVGGWAWGVVAVAVVFTVVAMVTKYVAAERSMTRSGISRRTVMIGGLVGIVGFFVIPVIGLPLGFVAGAFGAEYVETRDLQRGWRGAVAATKAAGLAVLIELAAALFAASAWLIGAIAL